MNNYYMFVELENWYFFKQFFRRFIYEHWYIQSTIALQGPHKDEYIVGIGWNDGTKAVYLERLFQWPDENIIIDMFQQAFQRRTLDLSGFEIPPYLLSQE